ncbi:thiamine phosphate synthase [Puia dinghuensis]|uniref:Thiamine phosphate synthase n=1 Tax=Puia dinghuensis TaxID=1792502 RepID=A0A8J2UHB1_9BACT|nr:thiamine phosphate synthase [Puia dinghuensis]GGB16799.1 thiamine phosphate synthase [Puia dinghuensis]
MLSSNFFIAVLTLPGSFEGEADRLEELLEAGVERLHLRKPEMSKVELTRLVERLAPRWASRLVLHYEPDLAVRFGVPQIHGPVGIGEGMGLRASMSVHSWEAFCVLPDGLEYAFISPLFDSISKKGYRANPALLSIPAVALPCKPVGLGGIGAKTIGELVRRGWQGAAVLGWIWEEPGKAVQRYEQLKTAIDGAAKSLGGGGL